MLVRVPNWGSEPLGRGFIKKPMTMVWDKTQGNMKAINSAPELAIGWRLLGTLLPPVASGVRRGERSRVPGERCVERSCGLQLKDTCGLRQPGREGAGESIPRPLSSTSFPSPTGASHLPNQKPEGQGALCGPHRPAAGQRVRWGILEEKVEDSEHRTHGSTLFFSVLALLCTQYI